MLRFLVGVSKYHNCARILQRFVSFVFLFILKNLNYLLFRRPQKCNHSFFYSVIVADVLFLRNPQTQAIYIVQLLLYSTFLVFDRLVIFVLVLFLCKERLLSRIFWSVSKILKAWGRSKNGRNIARSKKRSFWKN